MAIISGLWMELIKEDDFDYCIGGESAGIPFAQMLALISGKKFAYVRKGNRFHGLKDDVVGWLDPYRAILNIKAVLVEDMITDGASKIDFIKKIRMQSFECNYCLTVLDRQQGGCEQLDEIDVNLISLVTAEELMKYGLENGYISPEQYKIVMNYLRGE